MAAYITAFIAAVALIANSVAIIAFLANSLAAIVVTAALFCRDNYNSRGGPLAFFVSCIGSDEISWEGACGNYELRRVRTLFRSVIDIGSF